MIKPWNLLPAEIAHKMAPTLLDIMTFGRDINPPCTGSRTFRGLYFPNPIGIAGGVDKCGDSIESWWKLGAGFIEVGTVTPKAQDPNPSPILMRDWRHQALWNAMGFPNAGVLALLANFDDLPDVRPTPIFVNIGKNRQTPLETAAEDYIICIREVGTRADAFVVNLSSPNTQGLRDLFKPFALQPLLTQIAQARDEFSTRSTPLILKLSPDLGLPETEEVVRCALDAGFDGFTATNTTVARDADIDFPKHGGVSGAPLRKSSILVLENVAKILAKKNLNRLLISVGGILSADDVKLRLDMGANLVQVYSALVLEGPRFIETALARLDLP